MHSKNITREALTGKLREFGIGPTHQRLEIAHALFYRMSHLSADQVLAIVNQRHAETSKATVYNTLKLFVEKGLVREVIVDPSKVFYDPNTSVHHHFYDVETGDITDIDAAPITITGLPDLPHGKTSAGLDLIVRIRSRSG
jgi:Fur family iron response transcriptional regulator